MLLATSNQKPSFSEKHLTAYLLKERPFLLERSPLERIEAGCRPCAFFLPPRGGKQQHSGGLSADCASGSLGGALGFRVY